MNTVLPFIDQVLCKKSVFTTNTLQTCIHVYSIHCQASDQVFME